MSFKEETRYLVIKLKDLEKLPEESLRSLNEWLENNLHRMIPRKCVVVEYDWPEYPVVRGLIKTRWELENDKINTD